MALNEIELARIDNTVGRHCSRRTLPELRLRLSIEYRIHGHDVLIFGRRPHWDEIAGFPVSGVAKLKFTHRTNRWPLLGAEVTQCP